MCDDEIPLQCPRAVGGYRGHWAESPTGARSQELKLLKMLDCNIYLHTMI